MNWLRTERRRPRPLCLAAPLSASSVETMGFTRIHSRCHTQRARETFTEHARRCRVILTEGKASRACHRFSTSGFSGRCPTAAVVMSFPLKNCSLQIVLFTLRDPELNAVCNSAADERHTPRELDVMTRMRRLLAIQSWPACIATDTVTRQ